MNSIIPILIAVMAVACAADVHHVPADFDSIGEAVEAAQPGDSIAIKPGTYHECVALKGSIALEGENPEACILDGRGEDALVTVSGSAQISGITIRGAKTGILVKAGASLELDHCRIIGNETDGVGFETAFNTDILVRDCLVAENGDGIDLESTQGAILDTRFENNRDDGLDFDGDAGVLVYDCTFADNRDDGIEIRIATRTHALIQKCRFERNGEDGIEIINSPKKEGIYNLVCVQNSRFDSNARYGVGFVVHEEEVATEAFSKTAVCAAGNTFVGTGEGAVSANYAPVFEADKDYPKNVRAVFAREGKQSVQAAPVRVPILVGVYNLRPTTDGTMASDVEGVAVSDQGVFVADDNNRMVYVLDPRTGQVVRSIPTKPFADSPYSALGPEGLDIISDGDRQALLLADDDGKSLYTLSLDPEAFGHVIGRQDTTEIGAVEGAEMIRGRLVLAANRAGLYETAADPLHQTRPPVEITFDGFGAHIAGVGASDNDGHVFITVSGYAGADQKWRNHGSAFVELDPQLDTVAGFWHLGPFSNDPRGIAVSDGLVYVADGRSDFKDDRTGEVNRGGIKVFVFLMQDDPGLLLRALPTLPLWRKDTR